MTFRHSLCRHPGRARGALPLTAIARCGHCHLARYVIPFGTVQSRPLFGRKYYPAHGNVSRRTVKKTGNHRLPHKKDASMNITLGLTPLVSLLAGILILIMPRLLNYIVAFYLIVIGLIGLFGGSNFRF